MSECSFRGKTTADTQRKIIDIKELHGCTVLFLDHETPSTTWTAVIISGKRYLPVPVYDLQSVVAVEATGFEVGQIVRFE